MVRRAAPCHSSGVPTALVVGAGVSGLVAARELARSGVRVELWEAEDEPGGLIRPVVFDGARLDRGAHRVHPEAAGLLARTAPSVKWRVRPRSGRLILGTHQVAYPPSALELARAVGPRAALGVLGATLRGAVRRWETERGAAALAGGSLAEPGVDDRGFEAFVRERVGSRAYDAFYGPYAEKVWGERGSGISQLAAKRRVSTSNPLGSLRSVCRFVYPVGGTAALLDALVEEARRAGVVVQLGRRYRPDAAAAFDHVLYGGHLGDLVPGSSLTHRGLHLLHLAFDAGAVARGVDTWYAPERRFLFGRVSRPAAFDPGVAAHDVLAVEVPEGGAGERRHGVDLLEPVLSQLRAARILGRGAAARRVLYTFIPRVYPVPRRGYLADVRAVLQAIAGARNVLPIGRQGLYLHCNMDHAARTALDAVAHVTAGGEARAWCAAADRYQRMTVRD